MAIERITQADIDRVRARIQRLGAIAAAVGVVYDDDDPELVEACRVLACRRESAGHEASREGRSARAPATTTAEQASVGDVVAARMLAARERGASKEPSPRSATGDPLAALQEPARPTLGDQVAARMRCARAGLPVPAWAQKALVTEVERGRA